MEQISTLTSDAQHCNWEGVPAECDIFTPLREDFLG